MEKSSLNTIYFTINSILDKSDYLAEHAVMFNFKNEPGDDVIRVAFNTGPIMEPEHVHILLTTPKPAPESGVISTYNITNETPGLILVGIKIGDTIHEYRPVNLNLKMEFMDHYNAAGVLTGTIREENKNEIVAIFFKFDTRA
jgi:hypothetical protein